MTLLVYCSEVVKLQSILTTKIFKISLNFVPMTKRKSYNCSRNQSNYLTKKPQMNVGFPGEYRTSLNAMILLILYTPIF